MENQKQNIQNSPQNSPEPKLSTETSPKNNPETNPEANPNNPKYTPNQVQFLQKLVKEQRDLEHQIKILKKAAKEREQRKKELDNTIIKYFKTNDISHVNLKTSNCRMECVTVKTKTGMSQKYVTQMLQELLVDEDLAKDVLDYILSGRQVKCQYKLKTVENYDKKRKVRKKASKPDPTYTDNDKKTLIMKLKEKLNNPSPKKTISADIEEVENELYLDVDTPATNEMEVLQKAVPDVCSDITESFPPNVLSKPMTPINKSNVSDIIEQSNHNQVVKNINPNLALTMTKQKIPDVSQFVQQQMINMQQSGSSGVNVTTLTNLYQDLMSKVQQAEKQMTPLIT